VTISGQTERQYPGIEKGGEQKIGECSGDRRKIEQQNSS
jgi:hypothetical protein